MRRTFLLGYFPILLCLSGFLLLGCAEDEGNKPKPLPKGVSKSTEKADCTNMVCPVFYFGNFMGFHMYMGHKCADTPPSTVGLSSSAPLDLCNCTAGDCAEKCVEIGSQYYMFGATKEQRRRKLGKRLGNSSHHHHYYLDAGLGGDHQDPLEDKDVIKSSNEFKTETHKEKFIARLYLNRARSKSVKIALHTLKVTPQDQDNYDTIILGAGYEVPSGTNSSVNIDRNYIKSRNGKCLLLKYDGYDYLVLLGRLTEEPEE